MTCRILIVSSDFGIPLRGHKGASVHLRSIARSFAEAGIEVGIASRERGEEAGRLDFPASLFTLAGSPRPGDPSFHPDAMNRSTAERLGTIADGFRCDMIYERYALWATTGLDVAARRDIPFFLEVNAPLTLEAKRWRRLSHPALAEAAERRLAIEATRLFPVSAPLADHLVRLGADRRRVEVIPNGIDESLLALPLAGTGRNESPAASVDRPFTIGFAGSLKEWHGIPEILAAHERLGGAAAGFRLRIAGDGPLAGSVREASRRDPGIDWLGAVPHQAISGFLSSLDAGLAPYIEEEPGYFSPMKIVEYQAAGIPVVASGGQGVRDLVRHEETGLLVPAGDATVLADAVGRLRADPSLARRLAENARRSVAHRTWRGNARRILSIADRLPSTSGAAAPRGGCA